MLLNLARTWLLYRNLDQCIPVPVGINFTLPGLVVVTDVLIHLELGVEILMQWLFIPQMVSFKWLVLSL